MPYTTITDVLNLWSQVGIFAYLLPFLMIFAIIFGILSKTKIFGADNKGVNIIIALSAGLLSLQSDYVSNFFANIFPYTGVGIAVLLIALILMGLGTKEGDNSYKMWLIIGGIIFAIVIITSFSDIYWWGGKGYEVMQNWPLFLALMIVGFAFWMIVKSPKKP